MTELAFFLVAGSAIFNDDDDITSAMKRLRAAAQL